MKILQAVITSKRFACASLPLHPPPPPPPRVIKSPGRRSQESNKPTIKRAIERPSDGYTDRPVSISAQCQYFKAVNLIVAKSRESPNTYNALKTPSTLKRSFVKGSDCQWEKRIALALRSTRRIRKIRWTNNILKAWRRKIENLSTVVCLLLDPSLNTIKVLIALKCW